MTISSLFIKEQQEGNIKVDVLFIMMEKVQEGFCEELMKPANQYGYKLNKAAYRTKDIVCGSLPRLFHRNGRCLVKSRFMIGYGENIMWR